ncbi:MAG: RNA polymerase sigma-54 factor, partial [Flavobacteriaceae bacterium]|nr:RNA polymerase sigma-54 factor [Flavobacteriaceae bacterium]
MLKQFLQLKLSQKLSPQQIQLMKLIELPLQELEDRLSREIEENPALETGKENEKDLYETESDYEQEPKNEDSELNVEDYLSDDDIPDYKLKTNNYSDDDEEKSLPFVSGISFNEFLKKQLTPFNLNEDDSKIAEFLVGSVDQSGYIRTDIVDIVDDLAFTMGIYTDINSVTKILNKIHLLDPPGVGARDLQECLILQLKRKKESSSAIHAINILNNNFDLFIKK